MRASGKIYDLSGQFKKMIICFRQGECVQQGHVTETTESVSPSILDSVVTLMLYIFAFMPLQCTMCTLGSTINDDPVVKMALDPIQ